MSLLCIYIEVFLLFKRKPYTLEKHISYISMRSRRLYLSIQKIRFVKGKFGEQLIQQEPDTEIEVENIRSQRYSKEVKKKNDSLF